jgi:dimethylglycine dehydrogenase
VRAECLAVRDAVGLFETSAYAKFLVSGAGALDWLQSLTCNALPSRLMRVGLAPLVAASGRLIGDLTVTRLDGDRALLIGAPQAEALYARILNAPSPGITVENLTEAWGGLSLSGPEAPALLANLDIVLSPFNAAWHGIGAARVLALGLSFTGEAGAEVYAPTAVMRHVYDAVVGAGQAYGLRAIGVSALNALRLEKLYPSFGADLGSDVDPFEASLGRYVNATHASSALLARGKVPAQKLCGLLIDAGKTDPVGGEPVFLDGRVVGRVSSAAYGHRIDCAIALAYLRMAEAVEGQRLLVRVLGRDLPAVVTHRPPYDPEGLRLQSPGLPTKREVAA